MYVLTSNTQAGKSTAIQAKTVMVSSSTNPSP
jgi:hypothetical protein